MRLFAPYSPRQRRHMPARQLVVAVLVILIVVVACASGGVQLGSNWVGSRMFVLSRVHNQLTVVGIDPDRRTAEALIIIPSRSDDNSLLAPQLVQLADGHWLASVPRNGNKPARLYSVNRADRTLDARRDLDVAGVLVPTAGPIAAIETSRGRARAVLYQPTTWGRLRTVELGGTARLVEGDPQSSRLCVADVTDRRSVVAIFNLDTAVVVRRTELPSTGVQAMACGPGRPLVASGTSKDAQSDPVLRIDIRNGADVLTSSAGRVDRVVADNKTVTAMVATGGHIEVVQLIRDGGRELQRVRVNSLSAVDAVGRFGTKWVLVSGETCAVVDLENGSSHNFAMPGPLVSMG